MPRKYVPIGQRGRSGSKTTKRKSVKRKGSKAPKRKSVTAKRGTGRSARTGKKLYYGIKKVPKNHKIASSGSSLRHKQVRRFGEYEVPHRQMIAYAKAHHLPKPNYRTHGMRAGSKTAKRRTTHNPYIQFLKANKGQGHSLAKLREMYHDQKR